MVDEASWHASLAKFVTRQPPKGRTACLHGRAVKATTTRASSGFFEMLAKKCLRSADAYEEKDTRIVPSHHALHSILRESPVFMSDGTIAKVRRITLALGATFMECREYLRSQKVLSSGVTLEVHRMQHLLLFCAALNPALVSAYEGESQVVTTCSVYKMSMSGRCKAYIQTIVLRKRVAGLVHSLEITSWKVK